MPPRRSTTATAVVIAGLGTRPRPSFHPNSRPHLTSALASPPNHHHRTSSSTKRPLPHSQPHLAGDHQQPGTRASSQIHQRPPNAEPPDATDHRFLPSTTPARKR